MAKRRPLDDEEEPAGGESGQQMISIAISLKLLVYFIYLSSLAAADTEKSKQAIESLRSSFGILRVTQNASPVKRTPRFVPIDKDLAKLVQEFRRVIREENLEDLVDVFVERDDLVINFSDKILFPSGSAEMHQNATTLLDKLGKLIKTSNRQVRVEGHTDNRPITTERYPSNWELSAARASTVLRYLSERWSIHGDILTAIGFGEYQPLASNSTAEGRAKNRRVSILLIGKGKSDAQKEG